MIDRIKPFPFDLDGQSKFFEIYNQYTQERGDDNDKKTKKDKIDAILNKCNTSEFNFQDHQKMVRDFLSPISGYRGILLCHEPGTGKTLAAINIAEQYMDQIKQYGSKIVVLVPNRGTKVNFIDEIVKYRTNAMNTFMKKKTYDKKAIRQLKKEIKDQYHFTTQDNFRNIVIGTRQRIDTSSGKKKYFINSKGLEERKRSSQRLDYLTNTVFIIDEAHNMTNDNEIKKAVDKIIHHKKTKNLKIILLTATPMKNTILDIVPLMNFILPKNKQLEKKMIVSNPNVAVDRYELTKNWFEVLRTYVGNHISYLKTNPETFPDVLFVGSKLEDIDLFKIFRCKMSNLQTLAYDYVQKKADEMVDKTANAFSKNLQAVQMFCFPVYKSRTKTIAFTHKMSAMINNFTEEIQKKNKEKVYLNKIGEMIGTKVPENFIEINTVQDKQVVDGAMLNMKYLKHFSSKYSEVMKNILDPINLPYKGFVYSDRVDVGVFLFSNILKRNGFVEYNKTIYQDSGEYNQIVFADVRCYKCGVELHKHKNINHTYHPSTFILFTGTNDDNLQKEQLLEIFNRKENIHGEKIKLIVASRVMKEGRSLKNTCHEHILEAQYTVTAIQQIIGRARRHCSHVDLTTYKNPLPVVRVYLYAASFKSAKALTNDEDMYVKASRKYKSIQLVMECLRDISFDCAIQYNRNSIVRKCASDNLNEKYWNNKTKSYNQPQIKKNISTNDGDIDYYCHKLQEFFFEQAIMGNIYTTVSEIKEYVEQIFKKKKSKSYNENVLFEAIDRYIPKSKNDIFTHKYWLYDSELNEGYLIQKEIKNLENKSITTYIFQPYNQSEKISLDDRLGNQKMINQPSHPIEMFIKDLNPEEFNKIESARENFSVDEEYYSKRKENIVYGTIVKDNLNYENQWGLFKIRGGLDLYKLYGRFKGIPTKEGQYYLTKSTPDLKIYAKKLKLKIESNDKRMIGKAILHHLLNEEQTTTDPLNNSYIQIPTNHPTIPFPLNIKDRKANIYLLEKEYPKNVIVRNMKKKNLKIIINNLNDEINEILLQVKAKLYSPNKIDVPVIYTVDLSVREYDMQFN
jgi:DNA polymerase III delta prime subunit